MTTSPPCRAVIFDMLGVLTDSEPLINEDAVNGVRAVKAAGMRCLAVARSLPAEKLKQADRILPGIASITLSDLIPNRDGWAKRHGLPGFRDSTRRPIKEFEPQPPHIRLPVDLSREARRRDSVLDCGDAAKRSRRSGHVRPYRGKSGEGRRFSPQSKTWRKSGRAPGCREALRVTDSKAQGWTRRHPTISFIRRTHP